MKHLFTLALLFPIAATAQVTWEVDAGGSTAPGSTTDPYYAPSELTIHAGDHVHWEAVSGSHNVYGALDMFPDNPEAFDSGDPSSDLDFTFTFNIVGVYHYHCTQEGHAATQMGMITVLSNTQGIEEETRMGRLTLFPVPADGLLTLELEGSTLRTAEVLSVDGRVQRTIALNGLSRATINVEGLAAGRYLLRLVDARGASLARPFLLN
jgi:plastocyanin